MNTRERTVASEAIVQFDRLAKRLAYEYAEASAGAVDAEDLLQEARLAIALHAPEYRPGPTSLKGFVRLRIRQALSEYLRTNIEGGVRRVWVADCRSDISVEIRASRKRECLRLCAEDGRAFRDPVLVFERRAIGISLDDQDGREEGSEPLTRHETIGEPPRQELVLVAKTMVCRIYESAGWTPTEQEVATSRAESVSFKEIAATLGVSPNAAEHAFRRARVSALAVLQRDERKAA